MTNTRQRTRARPAPLPAHPPGNASPAAQSAALHFDAARLQLAADRVVEGSCLTAIAAVPLYLSILTPTVYETDKAVLLTVLSIVAATGWAVGAVTRWRLSGLRISRQPMLWLGLAVVTAYGLGTVFSVDPWQSLVGTYSRHGGLLMHAALFVFFLCMLTRLTTRRHIERLITVLLFASVPAVVYGFFQQAGLEPIQAIGDPATLQWPVRSTFGQHLFFASYLVLVIPLTAARFLTHREQRPDQLERGSLLEALLATAIALVVGVSFVGMVAVLGYTPAATSVFPLLLGVVAVAGVGLHEMPDTAVMHRWRLGGYGALLLLQTLALIITSARGPLVAFLVSGAVFVLLLALRQRSYRLAAAGLAVCGLVVLAVAVLNIPGGPLERLRAAPGLTKLAHLDAFGGGESSTAGRLQVWNGVGTLLTQQPSIGHAFGGPARDVVGYGPDSLGTDFEAVFPLQLRRLVVEGWLVDRAHSVYLDILVDAGALGLLAYLLTVAYSLACLLRALTRIDRPTSWLVIGIVSAVVGHLLEGVTGMETAASLLLLWILLAFGSTVQADLLPREVEKRSVSPVRTAGYVCVALSALVLIVSIPALMGHSTLLGSVWILSAVAAVAGAASVLRGPAARKTPVPGRTGRRLPIVAAGTIAVVLGLLCLATQWRFETAAIASSAGLSELSRGQISQGLGNQQLAVRAASYEPVFWTSLSASYASIVHVMRPTASTSVPPASAQDAATIDPSSVLTLSRGEVVALALASAQQVVSLAPNDPESHGTLGKIELELGLPLQAYADFRAAARLSRENPRFEDLEAVVLSQAHRMLQARALAANAVQLDTRFWYSYFVLAQIDSQLGRHRAARVEAAKGVFWSPLVHPPVPGPDLALLRRLQSSG